MKIYNWKPPFSVVIALICLGRAHGQSFVNAPQPIAPEDFDRSCHNQFGRVSFLGFVVRIIYYNPVEDYTPPVVIATGSIVTEDWVLTACTPMHQPIYLDYIASLRILPVVTPYSNQKPDRQKGIFPYADTVKGGCIVGRYHVWPNINGDEYTTATGEECAVDHDSLPTKVAGNLLLLKMRSRIEVGDYTIFPRMPFSYNFDSLVGKIDWFNTYRSARCIVAKTVTTYTVKQNEDDLNKRYRFSDKFAAEGFTYRTIPFRTECVPVICDRNCTHLIESRFCQSEIKQKGFCIDVKECMDRCSFIMSTFTGTLLCLTRMHESANRKPVPYTLTFDENNEQVPFLENNNDCDLRTGTAPSDGSEPIKFSPSIMGAPVVCDGEAIAVITRCEKDFIVATSIVPIRHRLLKLFDTSYEKDLVFLSGKK